MQKEGKHFFCNAAFPTGRDFGTSQRRGVENGCEDVLIRC